MTQHLSLSLLLSRQQAKMCATIQLQTQVYIGEEQHYDSTSACAKSRENAKKIRNLQDFL